MKTIPIFAAVTLTALLAACGGPKAGVPAPVQAAVVTSIDGTVQDWTKGAATVGLYGEGAALATAPLAASGKFDLTLPSATTVAPYLAAVGNAVINEEGCSGNFASSDQQAQGLGLSDLSVTNSSGAVLADIDAFASTAVTKENTADRFVAETSGHVWLYIDRATTLSGSVTCKGTSEGVPLSFTIAINAKVATGWNILNVNGTVTATTASSTIDTSIAITGGTDGPALWSDSGDTASSMSRASVGFKQLPTVQDALNHLPLFKK